MPRKPKVTNRKTITPGDIFDNDGNVVGRVPIGEENEDLQIEVAENESKPPSLKERFFNTFETPKEPKKTGRVSKTTQNELIGKALPVVFSALIVQLSRNMVPDPYKACCPTKEEVQDILLPFFSILSRRIKVNVGASKDVLDIIACLTATAAYGTRALITVEFIKKREEKQDDRGTISREDNRITRDTISEATINHDYADTQNSSESNTKGETQLFSELFRRDVDGRKQMGLLSRGV